MMRDLPDVVRRCGTHSCPAGGCEKEEDEVRRFAAGPSPTIVPASIRKVVGSSGAPLAPDLSMSMSRVLKREFSDVRVHTDPAAAASAADIAAHAYAVGNHIAFGAGQFAPSTATGWELLAHELTHVVQQPRVPADLGTLRMGSADDPVETEATRVSRRTASRLRP